MLKSLRLTPHTFVALCSVLLLLSGCGQQKSQPKTVSALPVTTIAVQPHNESFWIETVGDVEGTAQTEIVPQVSGILKKISYREGSTVKAGEVLFVIDDRSYKAALQEAQAARQQARATLEQAHREALRNAELYRNKAVSQKAKDDAQSTYLTAQAAFSSAQAKEKMAAIDLEHTRVTAPSDGVAGKAEINPGTLVAASSTVLTHLTQPHALRVNFQVSDRDLAGNTVTTANAVRIRSDNSAWQDAKLDYVASQINASSATLSLRALVDSSNQFKPGQFVHVQLAGRILTNAYRVPQSAVLQKPDGTYQVYVYREGKARATTITVGPWQDTDWVVTAGLQTGDQVITDQIQRLKDGSAVKLASSKSAS